jgi:hypothetical protein
LPDASARACGDLEERIVPPRAGLFFCAIDHSGRPRDFRHLDNAARLCDRWFPLIAYTMAYAFTSPNLKKA